MSEESALSNGAVKATQSASFSSWLPEVAKYINSKSLPAGGFSPNGLLKKLRDYGLKARRLSKQTVLAQAKAVPNTPTLLIYFPTAGKNLHAAVLAVEAWRKVAGSLPATFKFLVGPVDRELLEAQRDNLAADAILYTEGEYSNGRPLLSLGLKGLLEIELRAKTLSKPAPAAYSETMPAASWVIIRALDAIKSDSQEVKVPDFEEGLAPLPSAESKAILKTAPEHSDRLNSRLKDYGLSSFIFELSSSLVLQTEYLVPTVNISAIECGTLSREGRLQLPGTARARLDLHLVPYQNPAKVFDNLREYLETKGFEGLEVVQLPGAYFASRTAQDDPFIQKVLAISEATSAKPPLVAPISPVAGPLSMLKEVAGNPPAIVAGLAETSLTEADFAAHTRFIAQLAAEITPLQPASSLDKPGKANSAEHELNIQFELPPESLVLNPAGEGDK